MGDGEPVEEDRRLTVGGELPVRGVPKLDEERPKDPPLLRAPLAVARLVPLEALALSSRRPIRAAITTNQDC